MIDFDNEEIDFDIEMIDFHIERIDFDIAMIDSNLGAVHGDGGPVRRGRVPDPLRPVDKCPAIIVIGPVDAIEGVALTEEILLVQALSCQI